MASEGMPEETPTRRSALPDAGPEDLSEQIAVIRGLMATISRLVKEEGDLKTLVGLLDKYSQASTRLARLLKDQRALAGEKDLATALHQALAEVLENETSVGP